MLVLCYHNGALGHTVSALIDCCTKEGGQEFPSFVPGENLHHYNTKSLLYQIKHPDIDVKYEQQNNNIVVSSTSLTIHGRLLIVLMGLLKYNKKLPEFNAPMFFNQIGDTYGKQIEILSLTLKDKIQHTTGWFLDVDYYLDIIDFWYNISNVEKFLVNCGFTPMPEKIEKFCATVVRTNSKYFDIIQKCVTLVQDVINNKQYDIDLTFYETAMCHMLLLLQTEKSHVDIKLLTHRPTSTSDFIEIFKD